MTHYLDYESDLFICRVKEAVAIFKFGTGVFDIAIDLGTKELFFSTLARAEKSPEIKTILILNTSGAISEKAYAEFLKSASTEKDISNSVKDRQYSREEIAINQFIINIQQCKKLTVNGLHGEIAAPFFGIGLAFDFRFASAETVFMPSSVRLGLPPGGGLGFFLPRYIGQGKAVDLICSGNPISAGEACNMGLVNAVYEEGRFEERCVEKAIEISQMPLHVISGIKSLLYPYREDLERYLDEEYRIMHDAMVANKK